MIDIFPEDKLLTADQVAVLLDVRPSTVLDWALHGKIPSIKLTRGRKGAVRFCGKRLNEWLVKKERQPLKPNNISKIHSKAFRLKADKNLIKDFEEFIENLEQI